MPRWMLCSRNGVSQMFVTTSATGFVGVQLEFERRSRTCAPTCIESAPNTSAKPIATSSSQFSRCKRWCIDQVLDREGLTLAVQETCSASATSSSGSVFSRRRDRQEARSGLLPRSTRPRHVDRVVRGTTSLARITCVLRVAPSLIETSTGRATS